jgi:hypothetical protein
MNKVQAAFEYELLPCHNHDKLIQRLRERDPIDRDNSVRPLLGEYGVIYFQRMQKTAIDWKIADRTAPGRLVIISLAAFKDNFYSIREDGISVIALGNWKRWMSPPSIGEFIQLLIVREAIAQICPSLSGSVHVGTRGCVCDFTPSLNEVRLKALNGFVCHYCRDRLQSTGDPSVLDSVNALLSRKWLGSLKNSSSTASILKKLGGDLFQTAGLHPTFWERIFGLLTEEGPKELIKLVGLVLGAIVLVWLGLRTGSGH